MPELVLTCLFHLCFSSLVYNQDGCTGLDSSIDTQSILSQNLMTRKAGGRKEAQKEMQVCQYVNLEIAQLIVIPILTEIHSVLTVISWLH